MLVQVRYRFEDDWLLRTREMASANLAFNGDLPDVAPSSNGLTTVSGAVCRRFESFQARFPFLLFGRTTDWSFGLLYFPS
jgi:hypothetical protein